MKKLRLPFIFLIFLSLASFGQAQTQQPNTHLFTTRDGLPDNKVFQFLETRQSPFRWAITRNELCRFDGYRFQTVWERLPDIADFAENSRGELLLSHIGSAQSISCFEPNSGAKTTRVVAQIGGLEGRLIGMWAQDTMLFLITETVADAQFQVWRFFPDFKVKFLHRLQVNASLRWRTELPTPMPICLWDEKSSSLWYGGAIFGKPEILLRYRQNADRTDTFSIKTPLEKPNPTDIVRLKIAPNQRIWVFSTGSKFIWAWSEQLQKFEVVHEKPGNKTGLSCLGFDQKGAMIFRKAEKEIEDLWLLDAAGNWTDLKPLLPNLNFSGCTGQDFSRQIHFTSLEGVLRVNFDKPLFKNFTPQLPNSINNAFRGMAADREGTVWAMAEMIGLYRVGATVERLAVREQTSGSEILTNNAVNLQADAAGFLWSARNALGPHNLLRIDPKTGLADTFSLRNHNITAFLVLSNGQILLAATDGISAKLVLFDPATRQFQILKKKGDDPRFKTAPLYFLENGDGKIWVGGNDGLALFDPSARQFMSFPGKDSTAREFPVSVIFLDRRSLGEGGSNDQNLWIGTLGGGLRKLDLTTGRWEIFTMANGLPANKIAGILPDDAENLWVSTYNGLSFFQPEAKLFTNFSTANGLTHNEFNRFSFFKNADGRMFFGGLNGVSFFKPFEVLASFSQGSDSLLISQISWFAPDGKTRVEQVFDFENLEKITLPPDNRFCNIRLALANYLLPEANRFSWKLEGHDDDWHLNGTSNEITFHYLPAGNYRLRIRAANPTGVWGKNERVLDIEVREFWYKTAWAFAVFAAAVCGLFYFFYKNQVRRKLDHAENQRIKELDHLKTRLYTNITHEFRTPLTVILGMAERLTDDGGRLTGAEAKSGLALIHRNGKNLLRLINQLLDLSKLDSGTLKVNLVRADIIGYLQYLTESFYSLAQERKIRLTFYPETPALVMDFDEEKMQVIVFNLLSNALKFTGEGGKVVFHAAKVGASANVVEVLNLDDVEKTPMLQLKIQDTGKGIAPEELPHIFDRFYQADNSMTRKSDGTGIGLALVKELVGLLGGSISVESEVGRGSVFTVVLPIKVEELKNRGFEELKTVLPAPQILNSSNPQPLESSNPQFLNSSIPQLLVIEDNADVVAYIVQILKNDYQIQTAANGKIGIETALETVPDIIISDVMMPEKDGYEVCDTLKNDERTSHIPIILLTAKATQEDKVAGLRVGADAYLQKPFDKTELLVRLEKLVALRQKLQERFASKTSSRFETSTTLASAAPTLDDIFLQKIRQVIFEKMGDTELGILHLCRAVNLSHTQVFRKLKALTGENPTLFIRRLRLERAIELLKTTEMNVSEIAYEVGFSDPNYFSRSFHETFGEPPSAIRN